VSRFLLDSSLVSRVLASIMNSKIYQFKLVLLGESSVGKSSLVARFVKGQFLEVPEPTIGGTLPLPFHTSYQFGHLRASSSPFLDFAL